MLLLLLLLVLLLQLRPPLLSKVGSRPGNRASGRRRRRKAPGEGRGRTRIGTIAAGGGLRRRPRRRLRLLRLRRRCYHLWHRRGVVKRCPRRKPRRRWAGSGRRSRGRRSRGRRRRAPGRAAPCAEGIPWLRSGRRRRRRRCRCRTVRQEVEKIYLLRGGCGRLDRRRRRRRHGLYFSQAAVHGPSLRVTRGAGPLLPPPAALCVLLGLGLFSLGLALLLLLQVLGGAVPPLVHVLGLDELAVLLRSPALRLREVVPRPIPGEAERQEEGGDEGKSPERGPAGAPPQHRKRERGRGGERAWGREGGGGVKNFPVPGSRRLAGSTAATKKQTRRARRV